MHTDNHMTVSVHLPSMPVKRAVLSVNKTMLLKLIKAMQDVSSRYRVLGLCKRLMHECHEMIQSQCRRRGGSMQSWWTSMTCRYTMRRSQGSTRRCRLNATMQSQGRYETRQSLTRRSGTSGDAAACCCFYTASKPRCTVTWRAITGNAQQTSALAAAITVIHRTDAHCVHGKNSELKNSYSNTEIPISATTECLA